MVTGRREVVPTRSVLLELREEHGFVREGHELLDQKRMLLAAEMVRWLARYDEARARYLEAHRTAQRALAEAVARHGTAELGLHAAARADDTLQLGFENFLGLPLLTIEPPSDPVPPTPPSVHPSPEALRAASAFTELVRAALDLAVPDANLQRLLGEYRRTERRARALENVILPELGGLVKEIGDALEEQDQEEAARVRSSQR